MNEFDPVRYEQARKRTEEIFNAQKTIRNPYLDADVLFTSNGHHHLRYSARSERNKREQILKFSLFPLAIAIIKNSGTLQEYRK